MRIFKNQFSFVLVVELAFLAIASVIAFSFWQGMCGSSWSSCLTDGDLKPGVFLLLSLVRPFLFTPLMVLAWIGGESFGVFGGTLLTALGAVLSTAIIFFPAKFFGRKYIKPWLSSNLPSTYRLIRTQDYKIIFFSRMIPFFPLDLMSLLFGVADFRWNSVAIATFFGVIPEIYVFSRFTGYPEAGAITNAVATLLVFAAVTIVPLLIYEVFYRRAGSSLSTRLKRSYREIVLELHVSNDIKKRHDYDPKRIPVILLYGFFFFAAFTVGFGKVADLAGISSDEL